MVFALLILKLVKRKEHWLRFLLMSGVYGMEREGFGFAVLVPLLQKNLVLKKKY